MLAYCFSLEVRLELPLPDIFDNSFPMAILQSVLVSIPHEHQVMNVLGKEDSRKVDYI